MSLTLIKQTELPGFPLTSSDWNRVFAASVKGYDGFVVRITPKFFTNLNGTLLSTQIAIARYNIFALEQNASPYLLKGGILCPPRDVLRYARDVNSVDELYIDAATADPATTGVARPVNLQIAIFGVKLSAPKPISSGDAIRGMGPNQ